MQYVTTRYLGPTSTRPARIVARQSGGPAKATQYVDANHDATSAAVAAVNALRQALRWQEPLYNLGGAPWAGVWVFDRVAQSDAGLEVPTARETVEVPR
jgi:hypothetical protein